MKRFLVMTLFLALPWFALPWSAPAVAAELDADLSGHLVKITMGFEGDELLLFGAIEGEGDIVVLVHGPKETITVRRKGRIGPIWMNRDQMSFEDIPSFYRVMSTRPLGDWLPEALSKRQQIGIDHLRLMPSDGEPGTSETRTFREALIRRKQALGHYSVEVGEVKMLSPRLFRTDVAFPTNVPVGYYTVEIFLIQDGEVVGAETIGLPISKTGVLADIFYFAHDYSAAYGVLAIIFAVLAGLGANAIFRRI